MEHYLSTTIVRDYYIPFHVFTDRKEQDQDAYVLDLWGRRAGVDRRLGARRAST